MVTCMASCSLSSRVAEFHNTKYQELSIKPILCVLIRIVETVLTSTHNMGLEEI